jgi:hypothetical protein
VLGCVLLNQKANQCMGVESGDQRIATIEVNPHRRAILQRRPGLRSLEILRSRVLVRTGRPASNYEN